MSIWQRLTLRQRTAIIITLFIWIAGLLVGWTCRTSFEYLLLRQTDVELSDDAKDFLSIVHGEQLPLSQSKKDAWNRRVAIHPLHRLFIRVFDQDRRLIWESITVPQPTPESDLIDGSAIQAEDAYRFIQTPIDMWSFTQGQDSDTPQRVDAILQVGCSIDLVTNTIAKFDGWLFGALGMLLVGAPILAVGLSAWLLKPLQELNAATERIDVESQNLLSRSLNGDEIDKMSETLNSLLARVRSHLRENEDWIANSAHQLRGPLTAIISNVEVVAGRIPDGKSSDMLQRVLSECQFLKRLVNQLLLLGEAKSERHRMIRQEIAWHELVEKSSDFYEALAHANDIQIRFSRLDPCIVHANPEHLRFVIHNLIDNAIKYTSQGGSIEVALHRDTDAKLCSLYIRDTGIGISPDDLSKMGRRFFRSNSGRDTSTTPRGSGLGLHIVQSIVDAMGGSLQIRSTLGQGTEVQVSLPLSCQDALSSGPASEQSVEVSNPVESGQ